MVKVALVALGAMVIFVGACTAPVGSNLAVPSDAAQICQNHCHSIGMELSAVAVMASNVGCICQFRNKSGPDPAAAAGEKEAVTAGMATILLQEQEAQRQQQQQQQQKKN